MSVDDLFSGMPTNTALPVAVPGTNSGVPGGMSAAERRKQQKEREELEKRFKEIHQAGKDEFIQEQQTNALKRLQQIGTDKYKISPLNMMLRRRNLMDKLKVIIDSLSMPENYKGEYAIPFPEYKGALVNREYASGRYQTGSQTKIRYAQQPTALMYYEYVPELNEEEYGDAIKVKEVTRETTESQVKMVDEGEKVIPSENIFKYTPTPTVRNILNNLQQIYNLKLSEPKMTVIPEEYLPFKKVGSEIIYIEDEKLRQPLDQFIADLDIAGLAQSIEKLDTKSSFTESYLKIDKEIYLLNQILGNDNWTIEISDAHNVIVKDVKDPTNTKNMIVTRGYYLDALGNFKYGQLVSDSSTNFKNDVQRSAIMNGFLKRIILADVFPVFKALGESETDTIDALNKRIESGGNARGQERCQEFEMKRAKHELQCEKTKAQTKLLEMWSQKGYEVPQFLEICGSKPMKLLKEALPEPVKRPVIEKPEEEDAHFAKRKVTISAVDDDFKDITISKPKAPREEETKEE